MVQIVCSVDTWTLWLFWTFRQTILLAAVQIETADFYFFLSDNSLLDEKEGEKGETEDGNVKVFHCFCFYPKLYLHLRCEYLKSVQIN